MENKKQNSTEILTLNAETGEIKNSGLTIPKDFDWDKIEAVEAAPNVAPKYIEFNTPGTKIRGFYLGLTKVEKKQGENVKEIPVIVLMTKQGAVMNGGVALVDTVTKFCRVGEAIEIEFTGTKKVSNGTLKEYAVRPLQI